MEAAYKFVPDLLKEAEVPAGGILSRDIQISDKAKVMVFAFDTGQELSEHTASMPAILHFLQGEARLTLGEEAFDVKAGSWTYMPPMLKHSIVAKTPLTMLLILLRG